MKTYTPRAIEIERRWWLVDAEGEVLGRLATRVASLLRGKHHPRFTAHMDMGDHVVVVNAAKVVVTGKRLQQKKYYRHSGYPGGLREEDLARVLERQPERVIRQAVRGMLPGNRLGRSQLGKLRVYAGPAHPHQGQRPVPLDLQRPGGIASAAEPAEEVTA